MITVYQVHEKLPRKVTDRQNETGLYIRYHWSQIQWNYGPQKGIWVILVLSFILPRPYYVTQEKKSSLNSCVLLHIKRRQAEVWLKFLLCFTVSKKSVYPPLSYQRQWHKSQISVLNFSVFDALPNQKKPHASTGAPVVFNGVDFKKRNPMRRNAML